MKKQTLATLVVIFAAILSHSVSGQQRNRDDLRSDDLHRTDKALLHDIEEGRGQPVQLSDKWIGVLCRPVEEVLRVQLDLKDGVGLVIERIVPGSPAAKTDLQMHDILTQVDDEDITSIQVLVEATSEADENGLIVQRIRQGVADAVTVVPEKRPAEVARFGPQVDNVPEMGRLRAWVEDLEKGTGRESEDALRLRFFGPGVPLDGNGFPSGLRVQIQRDGDQPAKITVQKDDTTWEVTEDSLDQLPEEVRETVKGMLHGGRDLRLHVPGDNSPWPQFDRRLDNMNNQLRDMMDELRKLRREQEDEDDSIDA
jgi:hypothetical protein